MITRRTRLLCWIACWLIAGVALGADAGADKITVGGAVDKPGDWTVARIKAELAADVTTISYSAHDGKHTSTAVPLAALLKATGAQTQLAQPPKGVDARNKHSEMHYTVIVEGRDGYFALFSIAELMSDLGNRHVYLALDADGKPFSDAEAPMKLVVPEDEKPARWVHSVQTISLVKVERPATQPAK